VYVCCVGVVSGFSTAHHALQLHLVYPAHLPLINFITTSI